MAQTNPYNVQDVVQSLADTIRERLIRPSENKFTSMLEQTRDDIDTRSITAREQIHERLDYLTEKVDELEKNHRKMGILCLSLSVALVVSILIQIF